MRSSSTLARHQRPVEVSVLTLVRDRQKHLDNFIRALREQTSLNFELIIANMQRKQPMVESGLSFPVRTVDVPGAALPLARARNNAARAARGELLIFLDVDCIASPALVACYTHLLREHDACLMGEVRYLSSSAAVHERSYDSLSERAIRHPARPAPPIDGLRDESDPRALWGLSFAVRRRRFFAAGGMDTTYTGYGGEETDFAMRLAAIDSRFAWVAHAQALHQWHPICRPPLDHFNAIIANAQRFREIWGSWCLEYWLAAFARKGLIEWSITGSGLSLRRQPGAHEIARAFEHGKLGRF